MLEETRQRVLNNSSAIVDFIQADIRKLPFKPGVSDFIVSFEVLEHLPGTTQDPSMAIHEFFRVLKPHGVLLAEAPLIRHLSWARFLSTEGTWKELSQSEREKYYRRRPLQANHRFHDRDIESSLRAAGLEIETRFYVRVLPARLVEQFPFLTGVDRILEAIPFVRRLAREAIWIARIRKAKALLW